LECHSRLLLHVARSFGGDHDAVMDRYAYILERLRTDDCRRLRSWAGDRRSKLTTWLVVVAQRLSLDENRRRYGRPRGTTADAVQTRQTRRRLSDLMVDQLDHDRTASPPEESNALPDAAVRHAELSRTLARCLAELDTADQLLLTLRFEDSRSAAEIAAALNLPTPFHVYRRLDRLLIRLRQELNRHGVEDPVP